MPTAKKLPSGSWRVLAYAGKDAQGKRKYESFTAPTKREAERLAAQWQLTLEERSTQAPTVEEQLQNYIDTCSGVLSPRTVAEYRKLAARYYETIASVRLNRLTSDQVQRLVSTLALDHSPKTVRNVYGLLTAALRAWNPERRLNIKLPKKQKTEIEIPTADQVDLLTSSADAVLRPAIVLASTMGLRRSEICALTWSCVRKEGLRISQALVKDEHHEFVTKSPKSTAGYRTLPIPLPALPYLTKPQDAAPGDRIVPLTPDALTRRFERLCASLGLSLRFHALRHYYASVLLSLGVPDKYAMARMGHATPNMIKNVYQHLMADKDKEITDTIDAYYATRNATQKIENADIQPS